jgi:branched-chain amino acid transport system substrate-binding protein
MRRRRNKVRMFSYMSLIMSLIFVCAVYAKEVYKMGTIACVTGAIPQHGEYTLRGFNLALEDIKKEDLANGKEIELVVEDGQNVPRVALSALNKLINIDKVLYFETVGSSVVLACAPMAEESKVVLMNTAATHPKIREAGDFIFSLIAGTATESKAGAEFGIKELKAKTASILYVNNEYGHGAEEIFRTVFTELGGKIAGSEIYALGATDYRTQLAKIRVQNPDLIYLGGHANECGRAMRQAKELGIQAKWIGTVATQAPETFATGGEAVEGLVAVAFPFDPVNGTDRMKSFGNRFKERYGVLPTIYSANSYVAGILFAKAIAAGAKTGPEIKDYLYTVKDWETVVGTISFDKDGMVDLPCNFVQVRGGQFVPYQ